VDEVVDDVVPHGPQMPMVLPGTLSQVSPGQQSALIEHVPQFATQPL
jgi:hypothetical protein